MRDSLPELPHEKKQRYLKEFKLENEIAETIVQDAGTAGFFEEAIAEAKDEEIINEIAKWLVGDFTMLEKEQPEHKCTPEHLAELARLVHEKKITRTSAKDVLQACFANGTAPTETVETEGLAKVTDESELEGIVDKVLVANPKAIDDARQNPNAIMFLVGQVMKESKGQADPQVVKKMLEEKVV